MTIERQAVESSNIISAGYDPDEQVLEVEFPGGVYRYSDVPQSIWDDFLGAESKGRFFAASVRNQFEFTRGDEYKAQVTRPDDIHYETVNHE